MTKEALNLALEALETPWNAPYVDGCDLALGKKVKAITAIKEALANEALDKMAENAIELGLDYEPAQRTWIGLTDKEIEEIWKIAMFTDYGIGAELSNQPFVHYAKAIEAKLRSKNHEI
jgi:hypothetical protein